MWWRDSGLVDTDEIDLAAMERSDDEDEGETEEEDDETEDEEDEGIRCTG
jgi:hypothetical protein